MTVYFVKTRHHYHPYDDWYKLAELAGFETCYQDELDVEDASHTYIVNHFGAMGLNGNDLTAKAQIILWQTEHIIPSRYADYSPNLNRFWHMDAWQASVLSEVLGITCEYIPIGGHYNLGNVGIKGAYKYDVALLAYHSPRRQPIFHWIKEAFNVAPDSAWGGERERVLYASRLMVHIHQQANFPVIPGIRMALAAAHGLPVLCESVNDMGIYKDAILFERHGAIIDTIKTRLDGMMGYGDRLQDLLCKEYSFKRVVEGAI